jgi:hypothetical protein
MRRRLVLLTVCRVAVCVAAVGLGGIAPGISKAQAPAWIALTGPKEHALPADRLTGVADIYTPVTFAFADRPTSLTVTSVRLVERSESRARGAFAFRLTEGDLIAHVALDSLAEPHVALDSLAEPGTYDVTVLARDESSKREQRLALTYTRAAAALSLPWPSIRLETSSSDMDASLHPDTWPIAAPVGRAIVFPRRSVSAYLLGPGDKPLAARLEVTLPAGLPAGGQDQARLKLVGRLPRGKSLGSLVINSPQLREPQTVPVEIVSRAPGQWLFWLLVLGILAGWLLRWWLTERQSRLKAEADAHDEYERLDTLAKRETDTGLRTRLIGALAPLEAALARHESAAKLQSTTADVGKAIEEHLKVAESRRKTLGEDLKRLDDALGFIGGYPAPVESLVAGIHEMLQGGKADLGSGLIIAVEETLERAQSKLDNETRDAASAWLTVLIDFERCGTWPGTHFDGLRSSLVATAQKGSAAAAGSITDLLPLVREAAAMLARIRGVGARAP